MITGAGVKEGTNGWIAEQITIDFEENDCVH